MAASRTADIKPLPAFTSNMGQFLYYLPGISGISRLASLNGDEMACTGFLRLLQPEIHVHFPEHVAGDVQVFRGFRLVFRPYIKLAQPQVTLSNIGGACPVPRPRSSPDDNNLRLYRRSGFEGGMPLPPGHKAPRLHILHPMFAGEMQGALGGFHGFPYLSRQQVCLRSNRYNEIVWQYIIPRSAD